MLQSPEAGSVSFLERSITHTHPSQFPLWYISDACKHCSQLAEGSALCSATRSSRQSQIELFSHKECVLHFGMKVLQVGANYPSLSLTPNILRILGTAVLAHTHNKQQVFSRAAADDLIILGLVVSRIAARVYKLTPAAVEERSVYYPSAHTSPHHWRGCDGSLWWSGMDIWTIRGV